MKTLTITELTYLLNINRKEASDIIMRANESRWANESRNKTWDDEEAMFDEMAEFVNRNFALISDICPLTPKVNCADLRYHGRYILNVVLEGLGKGLSLAMKMAIMERKSDRFTGRYAVLCRFSDDGSMMQKKVKEKKQHLQLM